MMTSQQVPTLLEEYLRLRSVAAEYRGDDRCLVAPSPELHKRLREQIAILRSQAGELPADRIRIRGPVSPGLNDGLIYPGTLYPLGTPLSRVRNAALERAPLTGTVRVIVVLVDFSDMAMTETNAHFNDLFFSTGVLPNGSVREYYKEVTDNKVDIVGEVVGPYRMPKKLVEYAHGASGVGTTPPNARTMARDAAVAANPYVDFALYDNDHDGYVDAFIVVHAGPGAEVTGNENDIWSHKWVLSGGAYNADDVKIYAYLTVPEDSRIGVCCHELGHILFGFPDLYDIDESSEGVGNWCLMGSGNWNGGGEIPAHPSAWCKANQNWVTVINQTANAVVTIPGVETNRTVYRLWTNGASSSEYFLVENRQKVGFDRKLPGDGLLIWHVDDSIKDNSDENHYKVALMQADNRRELETGNDRGDKGDPYPGSTNNSTFDSKSSPNSRSYAGANTYVRVRSITPGAGGAIKTVMSVTMLKLKEEKEYFVDRWSRDAKDIRDTKDIMDRVADKLHGKEKLEKETFGKPTEGGWPAGSMGPSVLGTMASIADMTSGVSNLEMRIAALEARLAMIEPFIDSSMRPDLSRGALLREPDAQEMSNATGVGTEVSKRELDTKPSET